MATPDREALEAELAAAQGDLARLRLENTELAQSFREDPTDATRELLKRAAESLAHGKDRVDAAAVALAVLERTGSPYGLLPEAGRVMGAIAVALPPGVTRAERGRLVDDALTDPLLEAANALGVVLAATPGKYTKERPGRDADGRTVLDVAGRVEGDRLVPAISRASKNLRRS